MSIRMIAKELYGLQREVEKLEDRIRSAPLEEREALRDRLGKVRAGLAHMRKTLDGAKEPPPFRTPH